jgi:hypothetical protein
MARGAGTRLREEIAMHGMAKALLKTASVIALLAGSLLMPSAASAQFGFPGITFRVPYMGGGHYRNRHSRSHEVRHHKRSHEEPEETEPGEHTAQGDGKVAPQPSQAPVKDTQPPAAAAIPAAGPKPAGDEPTFSPSR